jgi:hypothetical protein
MAINERPRLCLAVALAASVLGAILLALLATVKSAEAAFPGENGKIVFSSDRVAQGQADREIYTMNANGAGILQLTKNSVTDSKPAFSPDGTKTWPDAPTRVEGAFLELRVDGVSEKFAENSSVIHCRRFK